MQLTFSIRRAAAPLLLAAATAASLSAQPDAAAGARGAATAAPRLRVAFVGAPDTDRGRAFTRFLSERFGPALQSYDRKTCDPAQLQEADVVVLDWSQGEGLGQWFQAADKGGERKSPLGPREGWHTPVVLIGSAGLNLSGSWAVVGGFG